MKSNIFITLKKELRGILRDKKYLAIILLTPFIIPLYVIFMGYFYDSTFNSEYTIGVNYSLNNNEMSIINELNEEYNLVFNEGKTKKELEKLYENDQIDAYIIKEDNNYTIYVDESSTNGSVIASLAQAYLSSYNMYLGNNYLIGEDIDPDNVFNILKVNVESLATDGQDYMSTLLMDIVISYLILIVVQTAVNTATDIIAGEKERGTLETLLTFPIKSNEIILGKFFAITLSCIITSTLGIILTIPAFYLVKTLFVSFSNIEINLSLLTVILAVIILILTSLLSAGLSIALSGRAKSFKEAQSSTGILNSFAMVSMFTGILGIKTNIILAIIPIANSGILLNDLFFNGVDMNNIIAMFISTIIYIVLIIKYISIQYKNEKTLF